jgi:hypothetical protein
VSCTGRRFDDGEGSRDRGEFLGASDLRHGAITRAGGGFLGPLGRMSLISFLALLGWILATSLLLWRRTVGEAAVPNA